MGMFFGKTPLKVGFLISYDCEYLFHALPLVYPHVDEVILAIDKNRVSWAGRRFAFDETFFGRIRTIDPAQKIRILEDDFYLPALSPIQNETRERNLLSEQMGANCWKLQIDVDEYFTDFKSVAQFLQKHRYLLWKPQCDKVNIRARWITLFKKTQNGYLYIDNDEHFSFATNTVGEYYFGRDLASTHNREVFTDFAVIHQSWARSDDEIRQKINNWGHKDDFDTKAYFDFWQSVDETNYSRFTNLHPVYPQAWERLHFIACGSIEAFCAQFHTANLPRPIPVLPRRYFWKHLRNTLKFWKK